jgi:hypothetical protein
MNLTKGIEKMNQIADFGSYLAENLVEDFDLNLEIVDSLIELSIVDSHS